MPKVTAMADTVLKTSTRQSSDLLDSQKIYVPKGQDFFIYRHAPDKDQHLFMELASPLAAADRATKIQEVYGYAPHFKVDGVPGEELSGVLSTADLIKLQVPYFQQNDNRTDIHGPGYRQCNNTSNAMLADYLLKGQLSKQAAERGLSEPESVYIPFVGKYGDTTDHAAQTKALRDLGIESYFSYRISAKDVMLALSHGIPVVAGVAYKGSGHIVVIVGHDPAGKCYLVHDPYGVRYGASDRYEINAHAAFDPYSYDTMQRVYWDMGGEAGWGRCVVSVNGKPTGLGAGL